MKKTGTRKTMAAVLSLAVLASAAGVFAQGKEAEYSGTDPVYFSHNFEQDYDPDTEDFKDPVNGESPCVVAGDTGPFVWSNMIKKPADTTSARYCVFYEEADGNMALQLVSTATGSGALPLRKKLKLNLDGEGKLAKPLAVEAKLKCVPNGTALFMSVSKSGSANQNAGVSVSDQSAINLLKMNNVQLQLFNGAEPSAKVNYTTGEWVDMKAILDPADDSIRLYFNGAFIGKNTDIGLNTLFQPGADAEDPTQTELYVNFFAYGKNFSDIYIDDVMVRSSGDTIQTWAPGLYNAAGNEITKLPDADSATVTVKRRIDNETAGAVKVRAIAAVYNGEGGLTNVVLGEEAALGANTAGEAVVAVPVTRADQRAEVFLWDNVEGMHPLCQKQMFTN